VCSLYVVCLVDIFVVHWICCVCSGYIICAVDMFFAVNILYV
jgi:hypothetical protein